jgi:Arc/MetJ family transcription regulator
MEMCDSREVALARERQLKRWTRAKKEALVADDLKLLRQLSCLVPMRTNIDIDDNLMRQAIRSSGARTKRAAVEEGLRLLIRTRDQPAIRRLHGKVAWEGDLARSRLGRSSK